MKRALFLAMLIIGSLTALLNTTDAQTWRLTDNISSDSLPKIEIDNSGRVLTTWLSNVPDNYDVYCRRFDNGSWLDTFRMNADSIDQKYISSTIYLTIEYGLAGIAAG